MRPRVLVAGIGNIFRTDDGFGCAVLARLGDGGAEAGVRAVDYGIRGMHLAYDLLDGWDVLVLVDAVPGRGEPGRVEVLRIGAQDVADTASGTPGDAHGMDPATVLHLLGTLGGRVPERTFLVGCQVADTGDGMNLSEPVQAAVDEGVRAVRAVLTAELAEVG